MNWGKINVGAIIKILREMEKGDIAIDGKYMVVYSDGKEQLEISYRKLDASTRKGVTE